MIWVLAAIVIILGVQVSLVVGKLRKTELDIHETMSGILKIMDDIAKVMGQHADALDNHAQHINRNNKYWNKVIEESKSDDNNCKPKGETKQ